MTAYDINSNTTTSSNIISKEIKKKNNDNDVGDLLTHVGSTPLIPISTISAKQRREDMINNELNVIIDNLQEYFIKHLMDELFVMDDIKVALIKAANNLAYRKMYYDVMEDTIKYFPSCSKLILSYSLMDEAEKYYYGDDDEFPLEYSKGLRTVVFNSTGYQKFVKEKKGTTSSRDNIKSDKSNKSQEEEEAGRRQQQLKKNHRDNDDEEDSIGSSDIIADDSLIDELGSDIIERLAMSWREATH